MAGIEAGSGREKIRSVRRSLQVLAVVIVALIMGITIQQILTVRSATIADTERQMARLDMVFAEQTGRAVETVDFILRDAIETLQRARAAPSFDEEAYRGLLRRRAAGVRQITEVLITDGAGNPLYSSNKEPLAVLPEKLRELVRAQAGQADAGLQFSQPVRLADGRWTAAMLRPIAAPDGRVDGTAIALLNLRYFEDFYRAVELSENGAILLHLRDGTVLARYPHNDGIIGQSYADLPPFKDILSKGMAGTVVMKGPVDDKLRVLAIRALKAFPLAVNVSVEEGKVLAAWKQQTWIFSTATGAASLVIVGLLFQLAQRSRQIESLLGSYQAAQEETEQANKRLIEQMEERERAEAALRQAQRIEAVGQLTGGVAHDFNNLLTVVIGNIDLLELRSDRDPALRERLQTMRAAAERGAMLTGQLLAFARRQPLLPRSTDLNALIAGMHDLLQSALGTRVKMVIKARPDLWPAMVDPTQIELVILNLAINARDAIVDGGAVVIETDNVQRGSPATAADAGKDEYVVVKVIDNGKGMTPEVKAKAFEPFFTTKGPGAGSGLGLSQVYGTASQSGGDVEIESMPGVGTTVSVFLPRAAAPAEQPPAGLVEPANRQTSRAVVLIVDDDAPVRATTAEILENLGYSVVQAPGGEAALKLLERGESIDLLLTDVVMPDVSGPELARRARTRRPRLPIVFISGYADSAGFAGGEDLRPLVRKPFRPLELREQIELVLSPVRA
jgi:signal transduction histidine kinase